MVKNMTACKLTAYITALANIVSCRFSDEELPVVAAIFTQLGDTLATISVQKEFCQSDKTSIEPIE